MTMWQQDARQRLMDTEAVGPEQFTIDQQTYIDDMPHQGRTDPFAGEGHTAKQVTSVDGGSTFYSDLGYDPSSDDWVDWPLCVPPDHAAVKA
jgi:hypothetical protein